MIIIRGAKMCEHKKRCKVCAAWHGYGGIRWCAVLWTYKPADDRCDEFEPKNQNREEISKNG